MKLLNRLFGRREKEAALEYAPQPEVWQAAPEEEASGGEPVFLAGNIQGLGSREAQEDSFAVRNSADPEQLESRGLFAVVADGMGGMAAGKEASQCAVDVLLERFDQWEAEPAAPEWLYAGACAASDQVYRRFGGQSGTTLTAVFRPSHVDMIPLGDIGSVIHLLITCNPEIDFEYIRTKTGADGAEKRASLDTRALREQLGEIPFSEPEVSAWIRDYIAEMDGEIGA